MRFVLDAAAGQHAPIAQLENEKLAVRLVVERRGEGANSRILVRKREPRLALVGRYQVETFELGDIAPATSNLAVGYAIAPIRNRLDEFRDCASVENAVTEIAEHDGIDRGAVRRMRQLLQNVIGDGPVIERVELQKPVAARDDGILVYGRPCRIDDGAAFDTGLLQVGQHEVLVCVVTENSGK